jgi:excinuclease ABC subunit B
VAILDADKEGYLRSRDALIQTMGRAARHVDGHVILYADKLTGSMSSAVEEVYRRRRIQETFNKEHGVTPQGIKKAVRDITERVKVVAEEKGKYEAGHVAPDEVARLIKDLETQMKKAAKNLEFERAALLRDRIVELRKDEELYSPFRKKK